jgi:hypothetical protein
MCQQEPESGWYRGTWERSPGVRCNKLTTKAEIMIHVQTKPHLLEYMDLQMEALDKERLRNDLDAY